METRCWLRLASHLHLALQECRQKHTSSELPLWMAELDRLEGEPNQLHIYLSRLIAETRRSWVDKPEDVNDDQFVLKFVKEEVPEYVAPEDRLELELAQERKEIMERNARSKAAWCAMLGKPPGG